MRRNAQRLCLCCNKKKKKKLLKMASAKEFKACVKLLKQTKKETKVLEGCEVLKGVNGHEFLGEGQCLGPLVALFDAKKQSETVLVQVGQILAEYLTNAADGVDRFVLDGATKKTAPCANVKRFVQLINHENVVVSRCAIQALLALSKLLVNRLHEEDQAIIAKDVVQIVGSGLTKCCDATLPEENRKLWLKLLLKIAHDSELGLNSLCEAKDATGLTQILSQSIVESKERTVPLSVEQQSLKLLYELSIHTRALAPIIRDDEAMNNASTAFLRALPRFLQSANGLALPTETDTEEVKKAYETKKSEARSNMAHPFLFWVWCLQQHEKNRKLRNEENNEPKKSDDNDGDKQEGTTQEDEEEEKKQEETEIQVEMVPVYELEEKHYRGIVSLIEQSVDATIRSHAIKSLAHLCDHHIVQLVNFGIAPAILKVLAALREESTIAAAEHGLHLALKCSRMANVSMQLTTELLIQAIRDAPLVTLRFLSQLSEEWTEKLMDGNVFEVFTEVAKTFKQETHTEAYGLLVKLAQQYLQHIVDQCNDTTKEPYKIQQIQCEWGRFLDTLLVFCKSNQDGREFVAQFKEPLFRPIWTIAPLSPLEEGTKSRWTWQPRQHELDLAAGSTMGDDGSMPWVDSYERKQDLRALLLLLFQTMLLSDHVHRARFEMNPIFRRLFVDKERKIGTYIVHILESCNEIIQVEIEALKLLPLLSKTRGGRNALVQHLAAKETQPPILAEGEEVTKTEEKEKEVAPKKGKPQDASKKKGKQPEPEEDVDAEPELCIAQPFNEYYFDQANHHIIQSIERVVELLGLTLHKSHKSDDTILACLEAVFYLCKDELEENDWNQTVLADLFCAATLQLGYLPGIATFCWYQGRPGIEQLAAALTKYLVLRGSCRGSEWRSWEEQEHDEEGNPLFDDVTNDAGETCQQPRMITKGRGADPNMGPNQEDWTHFLNRPGSQAMERFRVRPGQGIVGTLVHIVSCNENAQEILVTALQACANADQTDSFGRTPLMYAYAYGNDFAIQALLSNENSVVDVDAVDNDGNNVVKYAFLCKTTGVDGLVASLLKHDVDVNIADEKAGRYPLHWLSQPFSVDIVINREQTTLASENETYVDNLVDILVDIGNAELNVCDLNGMTPLCAAVSCGRADIALKLVQFGADPNITDNEGNLALHYACQLGSAPLITRLVENGQNRPIKAGSYCDQGRGNAKWMRTSFRCDQLLARGLEELVNPSALVDKTYDALELMQHANANGWSPFHLLLAPNPTIVTPSEMKLMNTCSPLSETTTTKYEPSKRLEAINALKTQIPSLTNVISQRGPKNINALSLFLLEPSNQAMDQDVRDIFDFLVVNGGSDLLESSDDNGLTCLHYATLNEKVDFVDDLLAIAAQREDEMESPHLISPFVMYLASRCELNDATVEALYTMYGPPLSLRPQEQYVRMGEELSYPAFLSGTPLTLAAHRKDANLMDLCFQIYGKESIDIPEGVFGRTAFHVSCGNGFTEGALKLWEAGACVESADNVGETALFHAIRGNQHDLLVNLLGSACAPGPFRNLKQLVVVQNNEGLSALHFAEKQNMESKCNNDVVLLIVDAVSQLLSGLPEAEDEEQKRKIKEETQAEQYEWEALKYLDPSIEIKDYSNFDHVHRCFSKGVTFDQWSAASEAQQVNETREQALAATRIQAIHRGRKARTEMKFSKQTSTLKRQETTKKKKAAQGKAKKKKKSK